MHEIKDLRNNFERNLKNYLANKQYAAKKVSFGYKKREIHSFNNLEITFFWNDDLLTIKSNIPAFEVYLHGLSGHFKDNFFTLFPNKEKTIKFEGSEEDRKKLLIWSLYDLNN